ncbi:MAG TPA: ADP-ribosylglycohydrolase family protein [Streptosporangiaceae bacterium]|nr:ADP-ribosylglycohydrolase family protein [Streptosporangiaceae bacterium]
MTAADRALGALAGLAVGDALGMPTQAMRRADILADYGPITGLTAAGPRQVIAAGRPAGAVTDDTEQALLLARLLIAGEGRIDPLGFAGALVDWEQAMAAKGSLDLLGPSTRAALGALAAGTPPAEAGRSGATNGAAMRIAPVGVAVPPEPLASLVDAVVAASMVTHNTSIGLAAAAAVGAAVSAGIAGASRADCIEIAIAAAGLAAGRGHWVAGGQVGPRIAWVTSYLARVPPETWADELDTVVGTSVAAQESVVAAFGILAVAPSAWDGVCLAASAGGDTDTMGAIVGSMAGAINGVSAWPPDTVRRVEAVNDLDLAPTAAALLRLRARC